MHVGDFLPNLCVLRACLKRHTISSLPKRLGCNHQIVVNFLRHPRRNFSRGNSGFFSNPLNLIRFLFLWIDFIWLSSDLSQEIYSGLTQRGRISSNWNYQLPSTDFIYSPKFFAIFQHSYGIFSVFAGIQLDHLMVGKVLFFYISNLVGDRFNICCYQVCCKKAPIKMKEESFRLGWEEKSWNPCELFTVAPYEFFTSTGVLLCAFTC